VLAGLAAVAVAAAPWLSRPWRRTAWATLLLTGAARLVTGGLLPMQLVLALAAGVTVGAGLLVAFGVPDRRMGPAGVAAALRAGGVPVSQVTGPFAAAKGSRPFQAAAGDGPALFVKVFGSDQRDADLLYRAWRGLRLRGVAAAVPLLQPLALSAGTRRAIKGQDGLLKNTRAAAIAASGDDADKDLARLQRVRPRTLLVIAALAGAFYFLLPQIAQVSSSWHALQSANWAWLPVVIALSALTYLASAAALAASVQAFGGGPGLVALGAVYLAAAALAAAAPTPGGLGAIEAALVAGLTGVGMQAGPAVSAVLLYRLATYWLPVLPGWLCWRPCSTGSMCERQPAAAGPGRTSAGAGPAGRPPAPPVRRAAAAAAACRTQRADLAGGRDRGYWRGHRGVRRRPEPLGGRCHGDRRRHHPASGRRTGTGIHRGRQRDR
jgi:hypothetical protein